MGFIQSQRELIKAFRLLKGEEATLLQSSTFSNRKALLSPQTSDKIANMILMHLTHAGSDGTSPLPPFHRFDSVRRFKTLPEDDKAIEKIEEELHQYGSDSDIDYEKRFYYLAYHAIPWQPEMSQTARFIFLHQLARCFGHVIPSETEDLTDNEASTAL